MSGIRIIRLISQLLFSEEEAVPVHDSLWFEVSLSSASVRNDSDQCFSKQSNGFTPQTHITQTAMAQLAD